MTLYDLVLELKEKKFSESKALFVAKAKITSKGHTWTAGMTQVFYDAWNNSIDDTEDDVSIDSKLVNKKVPAKVAAPKVAPKTKAPVAKVKNVNTDKSKFTIVGKEANTAFTALLSFSLAVVAWTKGIKLDKMRNLVHVNQPLLDSFLAQVGVDVKDYNIINELILGKKIFNAAKRVNNVRKFATALKNAESGFKVRSYEINPDRITYLKNIYTFLKSNDPSEKTYKNIANKAARIGVPAASSLFTDVMLQDSPVVDVKDLRGKCKELARLNSIVGGNEGYIVPTSTVKEMKENPTKDYLAYTSLKKELDATYARLVRQIVDSSGVDFLDVKEMKRQLANIGMTYTKIPVNYEGKINAEAKLHTNEGFSFHPSCHPSGIVTMNKNLGKGYGKYDPNTGYGMYCKYDKPGGGTQSAYTLDHHQGAREDKKVKVVDDFIAHLPEYRAKWMSDIKSGIKHSKISGVVKYLVTQKFLCAVSTELMYQLTPRPGSGGENKVASTKYDDTKGFSDFKKSNVTLEDGVASFNYNDKNGPQHLNFSTHGGWSQTAVEAEMLYKILEELESNAESDDSYLWVDSKGTKLKYITLKEYINSIMPMFNPHKFRNSKASRMAQEQLDACPLKEGKATAGQVTDYFIQVMTNIGRELGHHGKDKPSPTMAMGAYVAKPISHAFFDRYDVSPTKYTITKAIAMKKKTNLVNTETSANRHQHNRDKTVINIRRRRS